MALKRKISKSDFDALPEVLKAEYKPNGSDYVLDTDDASELERARDREREAAKAEREKAARLQAELEEAKRKLDEGSELDAKKRGDIETLEKSWKDKYARQEAEAAAKLEAKNGFIRSQLVDNVAMQLASRISTSPTLILPHIKARLAADLDGDTPTTRILDKDGKPSALTVEDLAKEFVANKDFSAIIIGSKATGGSAPKNGLANKPGSAAANNPQETPLARMSPAELAEQIKARKEASQQN